MINIQNGILRTLCYFHVFKYPLRKNEIWRFLPIACTENEFSEALQKMLCEQSIFLIDGYYSITNDTTLITRREKGCEYAKKRIAKANSIAKFLGNFPFVNSVCISGSLSKDFALPDSDLDFFIITEADRLWIARSFMHLFKKFTFLFGAEHSFCMNYYVSTKHLEISPKTIFTATELITLKPAFAGDGIKQLFEHNAGWINILLPNGSFSNVTSIPDRKWLLSRLAENVINRIGGDSMNTWLFNLTYKKWIYKWTRKKYDIEKCKEAIAYHYCTPVNYPKNYPDAILGRSNGIYSEYMKEIKAKKAMVKT